MVKLLRYDAKQSIVTMSAELFRIVKDVRDLSPDVANTIARSVRGMRDECDVTVLLPTASAEYVKELADPFV